MSLRAIIQRNKIRKGEIKKKCWWTQIYPTNK